MHQHIIRCLAAFLLSIALVAGTAASFDKHLLACVDAAVQLPNISTNGGPGGGSGQGGN